ncbi:F-box/FBD/LRR-repeat protein-like protein [Tanacetum coccineum]
MNRTSNLLPAITESILRFLPIEEAVRTSILSREWRAELNDVSDGAESYDGERIFDQPSKKKKLKQLAERRKFFHAIC